METVKRDLKYIADFIGVHYEELLASYLFIKIKGIVAASDIRFFSENGVPIASHLAKIKHLPVEEYFRAQRVKDGKRFPFSDSVDNFEMAIKSIASEWNKRFYDIVKDEV